MCVVCRLGALALARRERLCGGTSTGLEEEAVEGCRWWTEEAMLRDGVLRGVASTPDDDDSAAAGDAEAAAAFEAAVAARVAKLQGEIDAAQGRWKGHVVAPAPAAGAAAVRAVAGAWDAAAVPSLYEIASERQSHHQVATEGVQPSLAPPSPGAGLLLAPTSVEQAYKEFEGGGLCLEVEDEASSNNAWRKPP